MNRLTQYAQKTEDEYQECMRSRATDWTAGGLVNGCFNLLWAAGEKLYAAVEAKNRMEYEGILKAAIGCGEFGLVLLNERLEAGEEVGDDCEVNNCMSLAEHIVELNKALDILRGYRDSL